MPQWLYIGLGVALCALLGLWARSRLRYRVTPRSFKITLFGLRLRRIPLDQIRRVSTRRSDRPVENWATTFRLAHRILVVRLRSPARRDILITPPQRYVFKTDLEKALPQTESDSMEPAEEAEPDPGEVGGK